MRTESAPYTNKQTQQMEEITLSNVLPQVFAGRDDLTGDVWQRELSLRKGGTYLVEAASGTGKSTLCSYILGYRHDYTGTLAFDGRDTRTLSVTEWTEVRKRHVSHLFQELRLFPELTAWENVQIKNALTGHKAAEEIRSWFGRLGLSDKMDAKVGRMSFGQQQRVALMRALAQPFDFLLADEPVSHLDDANAAAMAQLMTEEARRQGAAVVVTSIGKHMALGYDRVIRL